MMSNDQTWNNQVKQINAQVRYERLLIISKELYKLLFHYQNPGYSWTCIEYNQMFRDLNKLCQEYDNNDWRSSSLLTDHYKTKEVVEKANREWLAVQKGKL